MNSTIKENTTLDSSAERRFTPFLKLVADDLYKNYDGDMTKVTIIVPNKRSSLFFNQYLSEHIADTPIWAPRFITIGDVFDSLSSLKIADPIQQICKLYEAYKYISKTDESLDKFYSWAELMKNDFEDIDNNMADAKHLFRNIEDLEELKDFSFLSEDQLKAIYEYFDNYNLKNQTELKKKFVSVWQHLYATYEEYHRILKLNGLCYSGMQKRMVVEGIKDGSVDIDARLNDGTYVIIGFNVLNKTERALFKEIQKVRKTLFYWDYDAKYLHTEAGQFVADNIKEFGNQFDAQAECYHQFGTGQNIRFVKSPTENAQTRYVNNIIDGMETCHPLRETAIVLCNENILQPVLHSIPTGDKGKALDLNVTMGYPFAETPIYSLIMAILNLQLNGQRGKNWRYNQVSAVLKHAYVRRIVGDKVIDILANLNKKNIMFPTDQHLTIWHGPDGDEPVSFLQDVFTRTDDHTSLISYLINIVSTIGKSYRDELVAMLNENKAKAKMKDCAKKNAENGVETDVEDGIATTANDDAQNTVSNQDFELQLYVESIFSAHTMLQRIHTLQEREPIFNVNNATLSRLIKQMFMQKSIPFHGEPANGLQVMGLLETRNLDFRNVIILSANEGNLPKQDHIASLIPYSLRVIYEMTTIEKQVSLYAYYFYNLLQRSENATVMYNCTADDSSKGEMSRFMMQMQIESKQLFGKPNVIELLSLLAPNETKSVDTVKIEKTPEVRELLSQIKFLSPTAINTYIDCPVKFYFNYVAHFREEDEVTDGIDNLMFGTIFHKSMEIIYEPFLKGNKQVLGPDLLQLAGNDRYIEDVVNQAFASEYFKTPGANNLQFNGEQLLNKYVIIDYVKNQLKYDAQSCPMHIGGIEKRLETTVTLKDGKTTVKIGGLIDRYEYLHTAQGDILRITDYKTNKSAQTAPSLESLFVTDQDKRAYNYLQALYYCEVVASELKPEVPIMPALMYIKTKLEGRECRLKFGSRGNTTFVEDYDAQYRTDYREMLIDKLTEIFLSDTPFTQHEHYCENCEFRKFCKI